jgi:hypothetical protein
VEWGVGHQKINQKIDFNLINFDCIISIVKLIQRQRKNEKYLKKIELILYYFSFFLLSLSVLFILIKYIKSKFTKIQKTLTSF